MCNTCNLKTFRGEGVYTLLILSISNHKKAEIFLGMRTVLEPPVIDSHGWKDARKQVGVYIMWSFMYNTKYFKGKEEGCTRYGRFY